MKKEEVTRAALIASIFTCLLGFFLSFKQGSDIGFVLVKNGHGEEMSVVGSFFSYVLLLLFWLAVIDTVIYLLCSIVVSLLNRGQGINSDGVAMMFEMVGWATLGIVIAWLSVMFGICTL